MKNRSKTARRAGDYTAESYTSSDLPEQSIYQSDERIFHRAGFRYDTVEEVRGAALKAGAFVARLRLKDGSTARLTVQRVGQGTWRVQMGRGATRFDRTSFMLAPGWKARPAAGRCVEDAAGWRVTWEAWTLVVQRKPFGLRIERRGVSAPVFELDTSRLAGEHTTPPLGFRHDARRGESLPYLSWQIRNDERFFGLGEKWNKCEKTSTRATIWVSETCGSNTTDLSYKCLPVLFSTRGWGLMLHTGCRSGWEVGTWSYVAGSVLSEDPRLDAFIFLADDLKGLLGRYTGLTGRPSMPPAWAFGTWVSRCMYENRNEAEAAMRGFRERRIPADVIHLDPLWMRVHYYWKLGVDACDFVRNDTGFPDLPGLWKTWAKDGFTTCLWINPYLPEGSAIYEEAAREGYLLKSTRGGLARLSHGNPVGMIDFTHPRARAWWKEHLKRQLRDGAGVLKPDYGDRVPEDALFYNGQTGRQMHNPYLHFYAETCYDAVREVHGRGFVWRRAGWIGTQRFPGCWAGDTQVTWEAMRCCLRGGLSAGLTGEAFWASDIGGFVGPPPTPEHYIRWVQLGYFSALTRFHGAGSPREPWHYGDAAVAVTRHYAQLRYRLAPYLLACARESTRTGLPVMRHMALEFPGEPNVETLDEQYMLGPALLVAPVLRDGARERTLYLPAGRWYPFEGGRAIEGGRFVTVPAPLSRLPLFAREGSVVPRYAEAPMHLKGPAPREIVVEAFGPPADQELIVPERGYTLRLRFAGGRLRGSSPSDVRVVLKGR